MGPIAPYSEPVSCALRGRKEWLEAIRIRLPGRFAPSCNAGRACRLLSLSVNDRSDRPGNFLLADLFEKVPEGENAKNNHWHRRRRDDPGIGELHKPL